VTGLLIPTLPAPALPPVVRSALEQRPGQWVHTSPERSVYETTDETLVVIEPASVGAVVNVFSVRRLVDERISPFLGPEVACERLQYALEVA
jgi:hypothetical protein